MAKISIYSKTYCPYCDQAKALLKAEGILFEEIVCDVKDAVFISELIKKSGMKTFPQIFHGDQLIGGYTDLVALKKSKGLDHLK